MFCSPETKSLNTSSQTCHIWTVDFATDRYRPPVWTDTPRGFGGLLSHFSVDVKEIKCLKPPKR